MLYTFRVAIVILVHQQGTKIIKIINKRIIIASYLREFNKRFNLKKKIRENFGSFIFISYFGTDICKSPNSFWLLSQ